MKILIIEDEEKMSEFIRLGLKEEGFSIDIAKDGEEGYSYATTKSYDVIILDLNLPKIDGITLCKKLRKENVTTPILILSVRNSTGDKVLGLDSGANDYLTKPFSFEELLARLRVLLRKKSEEKETVLKVSDLEIDLLTHKVTRAGKEIILTSKEFSLLEYLMRKTGIIVTRVMILEQVWGQNFYSFTNIVDVYINYLRVKIDKGFDKKLIKTIRGRGYTVKE
jgi:DNA-binding response OmpR family regulator